MSNIKRIIAVLCAIAVVITVWAGVSAIAAGGEFSKSSLEFISQINCGYNVGNAFDAWPGGNETAWGSPKINKTYLHAIREVGINAIRIPVTWYKTIGDAPNYTISSTYMNRVKEVIGWCLDEGFYVVLNVHHEGDWIKPIFYKSDGYTEDNDAFNSMLVKYSKVWTQIANAFKDCGERLIFESHNEIRDGNNWSGYYECYRNMNYLNQTFVDAVRATGGNNAKRYISFKGYAGGAGTWSLKQMVIPQDPANHLIFDFHSYDPGAFSFPPSTSGTTDQKTFTKEDAEKLENSAKTVYDRVKEKFLDQGVAVTCSEWGSVDKGNTAARAYHAETFISAFGKYGIKCFWWDNGSKGVSTTSEHFGIINRNDGTWYYKDIADAMVTAGNKYIGVYMGNPAGTGAWTTEPTTAAPTTIAPTTTQPTTEPTTIAPTTIAPTTIAPTTQPTTQPTTVAVKYGDVNGDTNINAKDVLLLRKFIAKQKVVINEAAADCEYDGTINAKDVLLLRKYIAKQPVKLGK